MIVAPGTNPFISGATRFYCPTLMEGKEQKKKKIQQPQHLVCYKPAEELYATLHTCIYLRDLPEITAEECAAIQEAEKLGSDHASGALAGEGAAVY